MAKPSFLIVKLGSVGDCVHTLYPMRALRRTRPDARIGWLVEEKSLGVVEGHPDLDEVIVFPRKKIVAEWASGRYLHAAGMLRDFQRDLAGRRYETAIDFQNIFKSGYFAWVSGAKQRIGLDKFREGNFLFMNRRIKPGPDAPHAVQKYMALVRPLGAVETPESAEIFVPDEKKKAMDEFFVSQGLAGKKVVAINPGASWENKRLGREKYAAAIDALAASGVKSVVIWGPGEEPLVEEIVRLSKTRPIVAPKTDIKELFALLSRCVLYLGNDSGPMHLAAAAGIAVAAVFGPSDPNRVGPWTNKSTVIRADVPCLGCWKRKCPLPGTHCMEKITADDLTAASRKLLELA